MFSTFGAPEELTTDGGTPYKVAITQKFVSDWGVRHRLSSVANPHSNARAEVGVKQVKRITAENISTTGSFDEDAFHKAILTYRNISCPFTRAISAMLLFGRPARDTISAPLSSFSLHHSWQELPHH